MENNMIQFVGTYVSETDKSWVLNSKKDGISYWFPKSECVLSKSSGWSTVYVPKWLAKKKGLK